VGLTSSVGFPIGVMQKHTHTHPFNGPLSGTTPVSWYQKGKTNLDFTKARDSEWQWHQLGHMQVCTLLQTDNHASTPPVIFLQAGCPSCSPANSVKALKAANCSPEIRRFFVRGMGQTSIADTNAPLPWGLGHNKVLKWCCDSDG